MSHHSDQNDGNESSGKEFRAADFPSSEIELPEPDDCDKSPPINRIPTNKRPRDTLFSLREEDLEDENGDGTPGTAGRKRLKLSLSGQGIEKNGVGHVSGGPLGSLGGIKLMLKLSGLGSEKNGVGDKTSVTPGSLGGQRLTLNSMNGRDNEQSGIGGDTGYWKDKTLESSLWQPGAEHTVDWESAKVIQVNPELEKIKFRITTFAIDEATDKVPVYRDDDAHGQEPCNVRVFTPNYRAGPPFHCPEVYDSIQFAKSLGIPVGSTSRVILKYEPPDGRGKLPPSPDPPPIVYNPLPIERDESEVMEMDAPRVAAPVEGPIQDEDGEYDDDGHDEDDEDEYEEENKDEENQESFRPGVRKRQRLWTSGGKERPPTIPNGHESKEEDSEDEEDGPVHVLDDQGKGVGVDEDLSEVFGQGSKCEPFSVRLMTTGANPDSANHRLTHLARKLKKNFDRERMKRLFPPKPPFRRMRTWAGRVPPKSPTCEDDDRSARIVYKFKYYQFLPQDPGFARTGWDAKGRPKAVDQPSTDGPRNQEGTQEGAQENAQDPQDVDVEVKREPEASQDGEHIVDETTANGVSESQPGGRGSVQIIDETAANEPPSLQDNEFQKAVEMPIEKTTEKAPDAAQPQKNGNPQKLLKVRLQQLLEGLLNL